VQNYVFPPSHAELLSVRGTYKKHDAGDETDPNTESQSAGGSEEGGGRIGRVMSAAKEIAIVERCEEQSLNASREAESNGQETQFDCL
jgi:hypothetical protein